LQINGTTPTEWDNTDRVYKLTFSKELEDKFGQKLEKDVVWDIKLKPTGFTPTLRTLVPSVNLPGHDNDIIIYDPNLVASGNMTPNFCVVTKNYRELQVVLYKMNPHTDLKKWFNTQKQGLPKKDG